MRLLVQFIGQAVGVMLLRRRRGTQGLPFKMWFYPLPAGADDDRLGVAFLADWADAKVGIGGNRARGSSVSDSRAGDETMALWRIAAGSCRFHCRHSKLPCGGGRVSSYSQPFGDSLS